MGQKGNPTNGYAQGRLCQVLGDYGFKRHSKAIDTNVGKFIFITFKTLTGSRQWLSMENH